MGEQVVESAPPHPSEAHKSLPTPFLTKTYQLVEDPAVDDVISWNDDGSTFIVWRPAEFARDLLPKYFKHNNFSSFVRQLNTYGFRKIVPDRWEFANDCFRKGAKQLLCDIHRRKNNLASPATPQPPPSPATAADPLEVLVPIQANHSVSPGNSSNSSPRAAPSASCRAGGSSSTAELIGENERLRKENTHLNRELSQIKSMCNNIFMMMSNYAFNQQDARQQQTTNGAVAVAVIEEKGKSPLELMPMKCSSSEEESSQEAPDVVKPENSGAGLCPRLFGVSIGLKRPITADDGSTDLQLRPQRSAVKLEPMDQDSEQENGKGSDCSCTGSQNQMPGSCVLNG